MLLRPATLGMIVASTALLALPSAAPAQERITNGTFDAGATGFTTPYAQTDNSGWIFVTTNPSTLPCGGCFPNMTDHTGASGNGNMLFFDGAAVGGTYYSVSLGVVPNSSYTFSYWTANLGTGGPNPLLATYLNGVLIGSTFTPTYGQWTPFTYTFNSESLSSITLDLADLTADHFYNDFALDDVSLLGPVPGVPSGVPEPSTWLMMLLGFGGIGMAMRQRRQLALAQIA
jgi:prepilin-type processing-associated H-X9-DG protein